MVAPDYGSTDLKDLEAVKPNKKEKRPPTSSLIVVLLQGVMQVGGFTAIIPTAAMYVEAVGGCARVRGIWKVSQQVPRRVSLGKYIVGVVGCSCCYGVAQKSPFSKRYISFVLC